MSKSPILFADHRTTTGGLADAISRIDRDALCKEYREAMQRAPSRADRKKKYFGDPPGDDPGNRRFEEHLALALWNLGGDWPRPDGGRTRLLDYQFPLYSTQQDGIGKIDSVGVSDARFVVIEMKVALKGRGDNPLKALMQGLRYSAVAQGGRDSAVAQANLAVIAAEAKERFGVEISGDPPIVQILAPKAWWLGWKAAGDWEPTFSKLIEDMSGRLGIDIECLALTDVGPADIDYGRTDGIRRRLRWAPLLYPVTGCNLQIGEALPPHRSGEER